MHMPRTLLILVFIAGLFLSMVQEALALPAVSISSTGSGVFSLYGADFENVGGCTVIINYDQSTLANPRVSKGGLLSNSTLLAENTNVPGMIKIAFVNPDNQGISGSGILATVAFNLKGKSAGIINSVNIVDMITTNLEKMDFQSPQVNNPPNPEETGVNKSTTQSATIAGSQSDNSTGGVQTKNPAAGTIAAPLGGAVALTGGTELSGEKLREEGVAGTPPPQITPQALPAVLEQTAVQAETAASLPPGTGVRQSVSYPSVLDNFRTFQGPFTPPAYCAIFQKHTIEGVQQDPPIALSDGVSPVRLMISAQLLTEEPLNYEFKNAQFVSLKRENEAWIIELLPAAGTWQATVLLYHKSGAISEIPLTVVPEISKEMIAGLVGGVTEKGFLSFIKERGTEKSPRYDLNGDGRRDYIDNYIFTGYYLHKNGGVCGKTE